MPIRRYKPKQTVTVLRQDQGVSLNPICQEELYDPGRNVSINPNKDSILTLKRPVPDVRLAARGGST